MKNMRFQREIREIMQQELRDDGLLFLGQLQVFNEKWSKSDYCIELYINFIDTDIYKHVDLVLEVDEVWIDMDQFHPYTTNAVRTDPSITVNKYCNIYLRNIDVSKWAKDIGIIDVRYVYVCRDPEDLIGDKTTMYPNDWERVDE